MSSVVTLPGLLRGASARFHPRIRLRAADAESYRTRDIAIVVRYGVMPDGSEVSLGRTVDRNLAEAREQYWKRLYLAAAWPWIPQLVRGVVFRALRKWKQVAVEGYEMTPLPPKG